MRSLRPAIVATFLFFSVPSIGQLKWVNVDSLFAPLPASVHIFRTNDSLDGKPNIAYYVIANIKDNDLVFTVDTTLNRRLTPAQYYQKNKQPLLVVNTTFFSFATNQNLNVVIKDGKMVGYNIHTINGRGKDTFTYRHPFGSAIGITKRRVADIVWLHTDSSRRRPYARQSPAMPWKDSLPFMQRSRASEYFHPPRKWKIQTAVGGGPVLIQNGTIRITNEEEIKFTGKAINDKHPRTGMGYTSDGKLIILVIEGRNPGKADGATLIQEAQIFRDLSCWEALNLDGGGSSCMLVNGKETIKVSDSVGQRPVPAVFIIRSR